MRRALLALVLVAACSANASSKDATVTVFAAASLTRAFTEEAAAYERAHPGADVVLSFAGSQSLVAQVQQGAPADVLATADQATMAKVAAELEQPSQVFAHNQLAIVTARGNPHRLAEEVAGLRERGAPADSGSQREVAIERALRRR